MGLFGGDKSSATTNLQTTTTDSYNKTTTVSHSTSNMGDIGLTGQQGVELAAVAAGAGTKIAQSGSETVIALSNDSSKNFQSLVGGASDFIEASRDVVGATENFAQKSSSIFESLADVTGSLAQDATTLADSSLDVAADAASAASAGPVAQLVKQAPIIILGLAGLYVVIKVVKK